MWPYWMIFFIPALIAISASRRNPSIANGLYNLRLTALWVVVILALTLVIGLRFEVGADWGAYIDYFDYAQTISFANVVQLSDPGYQLINWLSGRLGWGIAGVNLVCGLIFCYGLAKFCRSTPRSWLALTVALPYMLIVVAMGYSRQGIALGFAMLGLVALVRSHNITFILWILLAALFHKSAVLLLPIAGMVATKNKYWLILWGGGVGAILYGLLLEAYVESLYSLYIEGGYQSQGVYIRIAMNAVPAFLFLLFRKEFPMTPAELSLWQWMSVISLALIPLLFIIPSTTLLDRAALYILPLQIVVFSYLPDILRRYFRSSRLVVVLIVFYCSIVLFVWLNFANHASSWVPYQIIWFN